LTFARLRPVVSLWAPVLVWMAVIFALSAQSSLPSIPQSTMDAVFKKTGHAVAYAILCLLIARGLHGLEGHEGHEEHEGQEARPFRWRFLLASLLLSALYGASDELHQSLVPGRTPQVFDWMVDVAGAAAGAWLYARTRCALGPASGQHSEPDR
jgi:VanZ family protein